MAEYPADRLKCWNKAEKLRHKIYDEFVTAHERGEQIIRMFEQRSNVIC